MAKRSATSDLNHDNWDRDEDPEDAGTFKKANEESLKKRIIKTARRRNPISSVRDGESDSKSAFTSFTGFSKPVVPASSGTNTFSFLSNITNPAGKPNTNGTNVSNPQSEKTDSPISNNINIFAGIKSSVVTDDDTKGKSNDYYSKLKGLNESVSNWIKKHVDANPLINLQPIFTDYERYFKELEKEEVSRSNTKPEDTKKSVGSIAPAANFIFNSAKNVTNTEKTDQSVDKEIFNKNARHISFGSTPNTTNDSIPKFGFSTTATSNTFSFGNSISKSNSTVTPSFSFGGNVSTPKTTAFLPSTFNNVSKPTPATESNKEKGSDDEEDQPPKVEFTPVVEKDHIYTTRCKVFVKKDGNFGDRGVGNMYLKPIENSEKVQLIVRADTNLGNLLCNFILSGSIPMKRMGKKDVMLVCLPTPDFQPPPVPILLRVKSPEEADKLLEVLEKHKK